MIRRKLQGLSERVRTLDRKRYLFVSILVCACLMLTAFGLYSQLKVQVTVVLNGTEQSIETKANTVKELMKELKVNVKEQDYIHPDPHKKLTSEMVIEWKEANQITFDQYGVVSPIWSTARTVEEFLTEQGVELKEGDVVSPEVETSIDDNLLVQLAEYQYKVSQKEQAIGFNTIRKNDPTMLKGQEKTVVKGSEGKALHQFKSVFKNGELLNREFIGTDVIAQKRDRVIAVGTIASVSRGSYVFAPKRVLTNVTLTAYAAGPEHTGKSPGDKGYGMTRSGTRATEGRTIAVDPRIIPIGTWVYIEGIGLRRAEDTGGAVKGSKIDVYFEDNSTALNFGLKRGYKVYIIGKNKPEKQ
jgi:3D (Asp-Asp-Asp) domain-containing protein